MINNLHHFEILTTSSSKLINYLVNGFKFNLVLTKQTDKYQQYLINSNSINFLITSLDNSCNISSLSQASHLFETSLRSIEQRDSNLFNLIKQKKDTVFNAAFKVADLDRILFNCNKHNVPIIKQKHVLKDDYLATNGYAECAIIRSCIDGVSHTLLDLNNYKGNFLPGFETDPNIRITDNSQCIESRGLPTHFDHLTYATQKNASNQIIDWYGKIFSMKRFKINREEHNGLMVRTGESGMNIKAIQYWLCAETGVEMNSNKNDFKFVISEPIEDDDGDLNASKSKNQISIFLDEHDGPGIQHIGLHTPDIVESVKNCKKNIEPIKYYVTPDSYYETPEKVEEIKDCGMDVELLRENHILLDAEFDEGKKIEDGSGKTSYLLQVFTQPVFDKKTLFFELIQRVGDAQGFGAANIKALWNAVQYQINNKIAK